jgi:hypothetical protein
MRGPILIVGTCQLMSATSVEPPPMKAVAGAGGADLVRPDRPLSDAEALTRTLAAALLDATCRPNSSAVRRVSTMTRAAQFPGPATSP